VLTRVKARLYVPFCPVGSRRDRIFTDVFVDRFPWREHPAFTDLQVDLGKGHENHNRDFDPFPSKDFSFDLSTGRGRLVAGSGEMGQFGHLDLRLTSRGTTTRMSGGAGVAKVTPPVKIQGAFDFNTPVAAPTMNGLTSANAPSAAGPPAAREHIVRRTTLAAWKALK
jgi:hypothetical protein